MGIILRSFSVLFTDQGLHQHHYLRHFTKQVVAKNSPNIGICQKIKALSKGTGKKLLIGLTLLHSTHRKSEIDLLDILWKRSISFVINKIDLKADINTVCNAYKTIFLIVTLKMRNNVMYGMYCPLCSNFS